MNILVLEEESGVKTIRIIHRRIVELIQRGGDVVLDFSRVRRIDCAMVQLIIALRKECAKRGISCMITNTNGEVLRLLACAGIRWRRRQAYSAGPSSTMHRNAAASVEVNEGGMQ